MTLYYRPLIDANTAGRHGAYLLGQGWCWFDKVEVLSRGARPKVCPASEVPSSVLENLISARASIGTRLMNAPRLMGILNITPDSFSDGGDNFTLDRALHNARSMVAAGVDFLDIGGESTRPNASFVSAEVETARVLPIISALKSENLPVQISIDTRKACVAKAALEAGADIINDVSAFGFDSNMAKIAAQTRAPICLMHTQGEPENMQDNPEYENPLLDIYDFLKARIEMACAAGIKKEALVIDPGIGFGKTPAHNRSILHGLALFHALGVPILLGASRKSFIGHFAPAPDSKNRLGGSLAAVLYAVSQGIQILRVHDIYETDQAIRIWQAIKSFGAANE